MVFATAGIAMLVMIGVGVIVKVAVGGTNFLEETMIHLTTSMPTFDYEVIDGQEVGTASLETFIQLRGAAFSLFTGVIMFGAITLVFEKIQIVSEGTAWKMVGNGVMMLFFLMIFPWVWDTIAVMVEEGSKWIIEPNAQELEDSGVFEPGTAVLQKPKEILSKLTQMCPESITRVKSDDFSGIDDPWQAITDAIGIGGNKTEPDFVNDPDACNHIVNVFDLTTSIQDKMVTIFLALTSSMAVLMLMFMMFILGTARIVLTEVFIISLPIILIMSLIPQFQKVTDHLKTGLIGLMIVPIFTAVAIVGGHAFLETVWCEYDGAIEGVNCHEPDAFSGWFYSVAVLALITFMPTIIVPMLGSFSNSMSGIATGSVMMGAMGTAAIAGGVAKGAITGAAGGGGGIKGMAMGAMKGGTIGGIKSAGPASMSAMKGMAGAVPGTGVGGSSGMASSASDMGSGAASPPGAGDVSMGSTLSSAIAGIKSRFGGFGGGGGGPTATGGLPTGGYGGGEGAKAPAPGPDAPPVPFSSPGHSGAFQETTPLSWSANYVEPPRRDAIPNISYNETAAGSGNFNPKSNGAPIGNIESRHESGTVER